MISASSIAEPISNVRLIGLRKIFGLPFDSNIARLAGVIAEEMGEGRPLSVQR